MHRRLHLLDHQERVEFKQYLQHLCGDLAGLLFPDATGFVIAVEGQKAEIPTSYAIPLGFIVNELITNSAKYAESNILVRFETTPLGDYLLSVSDDGPGLPAGFDPANSRELGMRIVLALVEQVDGKLHIMPSDDGRGTRFTVTFCSFKSQTNGTTNVA